MAKEKLLFLGDLFYDFDYLAEDISEIANWIRENGYRTIVNLEGGIACNTSMPVKKRGPNLSSDIAVLKVLDKLNVAGVCMANNHTMDFGESGLATTLKLLDSHNIAHTGAGENLSDALKPMIINAGDQDIAVLSFGWDVEETVYATESSAGCAPRKAELILEQIAKCKTKYDQVIACMHWGFEYNRLPMPMDIELAHQIIDAGADLVIGHHPHCIQAKEKYTDKHIYYSLGNFYFASERSDYNKKFMEHVSNQSDYGLMVGYDSFNRACEEKICYFDKKSNTSFLQDDSALSFVLEDITGVNWRSREYIRKVWKNKRNINPILTTNKTRNSVSLFLLFSVYKAKRIAKKVLGKG